jgi:hypothetical protein
MRARVGMAATDWSVAGGGGGLDGRMCPGASAFGYPQIIDIDDETNPKIIANLMLEANDPANCSLLLNQTPPDPGLADAGLAVGQALEVGPGCGHQSTQHRLGVRQLGRCRRNERLACALALRLSRHSPLNRHFARFRATARPGSAF